MIGKKCGEDVFLFKREVFGGNFLKTLDNETALIYNGFAWRIGDAEVHDTKCTFASFFCPFFNTEEQV